MTDDEKTAAMRRLRKAASAVRRHKSEREDLAEAIVVARLAGATAKEVQDEVPYDRNHVGRIVKADGRVALRKPKASHDDPS